MRRALLVAALVAAQVLPLPAASQTAPPPARAAAPSWAHAIDAPEFGRAGTLPVGTRTETLAVAGRPGLQGAAPASLRVRFYYPAAVPSDPAARVVYRHEMKPPRLGPMVVEDEGLATEGAAPATGARYPLVVFSHGFGGWATHMSRLAEILASHGFVVAAIDHQDERFDDVPGFFASFGNVLLRRSADQRAVAAGTGAGSIGRGLPFDPAGKVGLIGYSMGGYGALASAGASHDPAGAPYASMPAAHRNALAAATAAPLPALGAVVLMAPWGGQPASRAWQEAALAQVRVPVMMVSGSNDAVVDYANGVRWIYDGLRGTERHLLTFREAGHNIGGNARSLPADAPVEMVDFFGDPVWRGEKLNQATAHFLTAFFAAKLKGDADAVRYLAVPVADASRGDWPLPFGAVYDGHRAGDAEPGYWRGFQRGRAAGMTLEHKVAGQ